MDERDHGIILRTRPLTETSLIVQWLARERGLISTVARGARRPKSVFIGKLDLYYTAHFTFQRSRRSELHTLREIELDGTNELVRHDLGWLNQAAYAGALIEHTSERETPVPEQYELILEFLGNLPKVPPNPATILRFELQLLQILGLLPDLTNMPLGAGSKAVLGHLRDGPNVSVRMSDQQKKEIDHFLSGSFESLSTRLRLIREKALREGQIPGRGNSKD